MEGEDGHLYAIEEELSDEESTEIESDLSARYSLLAILEKAREQYKVRQRDRYVNYTSPTDGYSALHIAAEKGDSHRATATGLRCNPDLPDGIRQTARCTLAAREGHREDVHHARQMGRESKVDKRYLATTPLHLAAKEGDLETRRRPCSTRRRPGRGCLAEATDCPRKDGTAAAALSRRTVPRGRGADLLNRGADWDARTEEATSPPCTPCREDSATVSPR